MSLIATEGKLIYHLPQHDGLVTTFGLHRDWRIEKALWSGFGFEYIEPLKALAPFGLKLQVEMDPDDWTAGGNEKLKPWMGAGNPSVNGTLFYDGNVYASGTPLDTWMAGYHSVALAVPPQLIIRRQSWVPPMGQGVIPQMSVAVHAEYETGPGVWEEAKIILWLPLSSEQFKNAFLHCYIGSFMDTVDIFTQGFTLSEGPASGAMAQAEISELWIWEYIEVWRDANGATYGEYAVGREFIASHILIRNGSEPNNWWHYTSQHLRILPGSVMVSVGGCQQWFTIGPIKYGFATATCKPVASPGFPVVIDSGGDENAWNDDPTWGAVVNTVSNWTVSVAQDTGIRRPVITAEPTAPQYQRPVVWFATEDNPTLVGDADTSVAVDTDSANTLETLQVEFNIDYKGAQGEATFRPSADDTALYDTWIENGKVELSLGWNDDAGAGYASTKVAELYIKPDGLRRNRKGDAQTAGAPSLAVSLGDFAEVRAARNHCMDLRQAGGMTVSDWATMLGNFLGIADAKINVHADVTDQYIPTTPDIPSLPNCVPQDGQDVMGYIREVERAADIRVGFNRLISGTWYNMFVDAGPPRYEDGVSLISYSIDMTSNAETDLILEAEAGLSSDNFRNVTKLVYGRPGKPLQVADKTQNTWYYAENLAARKLSIGDAWRVVLEDQNTTEVGDLAKRFEKEHYSRQGYLHWVCQLRNDIMPDDFIEITSLPGLNIPENAVYQVEKVTLSADFTEMTGLMQASLKLVYPAIYGYYSSY